MKQRIDHVEPGGGLLLGVGGICIISHGSSKAQAISNAVRSAKEAVENRVMERINSKYILESKKSIVSNQ